MNVREVFTPEDWETTVSKQKARIAELEDALRNAVAALKHYGPHLTDTRVVCEAEELLEKPSE